MTKIYHDELIEVGFKRSEATKIANNFQGKVVESNVDAHNSQDMIQQIMMQMNNQNGHFN